MESPFLSLASAALLAARPFPLPPAALEMPSIRCLVVSDNAMHRLTLEHYVALTAGLRLSAALCDGVEAYSYLQDGGEVDLVILDLSTTGMDPNDMRAVTHHGRPQWLFIKQMGNVPSFNCRALAAGQLAQPLCFSQFGKLVEQTLAQVPQLGVMS